VGDHSDRKEVESGILGEVDGVNPSSGTAEKNAGSQSILKPGKTTMFDDDYDIDDDDLFAVDETSSTNRSRDISINKSEGSIKDSTSLNLSGQESLGSPSEVVAPRPIVPFTIDPNKQMVVLETDPSKVLPPPVNFKKSNQRKPRNLHVDVTSPSKPTKAHYRLSNPDVGFPYTPLTPPKFYTPQASQSRPFGQLQPNPSTPRSSSPASQKAQDEEYGQCKCHVLFFSCLF
jgi:hypothetical protein